VSSPSDQRIQIASNGIEVGARTLAEELLRTRETLGTLITWLAQELGDHNVKALLEKLHDMPEAAQQEKGE
jgi:hypothetical protein